MLFVISKGSVPTYQEGQDPLVYIVTDVASVLASGRPYAFSDRNCAIAYSEYSNDLSQLNTLVDWDLMKAHIWKNTLSDNQRMERRMAEFLVHERFPLSSTLGVVTRNEAVSSEVLEMMNKVGFQTDVVCKPDWYFSEGQ